jgi:drug/metabolite transporter (DMT)-like permease
VLQALFVTFLWSTSWVLIKLGLKDIPALTFAGLRYALAFVCLLPFALRAGHLSSLHRLPRKTWRELIVLGLVYYAVTQGAQFLGLAYLPALTVILLLNFATIVVAFLGVLLLSEPPSLLQWAGVGVSLVGILVYFYFDLVPFDQAAGLIVVGVCILANALSSLLGRHVNRADRHHPLMVTTVTMGIGSMVLLGTGIAVQGFPRLNWTSWAIIAWLAVVNTAFAFTVWNHTLRTLTAMESSVIYGTMLIQVSLLAWLFLGEELTPRRVIGLTLAGVGALIVQLRRARSVDPAAVAVYNRPNFISDSDREE